MVNNYTSTAAAYSQLQPITSDPMDGLLKAQQIKASNANIDAEAEALRQAKAKAASDAAAKAEEARKKEIDKHNIKALGANAPTGAESLDIKVGRAIDGASDQLLTIHQGLQNRTIPNDAVIAARIQELQNTPLALKQATDSISAYVKDFNKVVSSGNALNYNGDVDKKAEILKKFGGTTDENGTTTYEFDLYNDPKTGRPFAKVGNEIIDVNSIGNMSNKLFVLPQEEADYTAAIKDFSALVGMEEEIHMSGSNRVSNTNASFQKAKTLVTAELGTVDDPSNLARTIWKVQLNQEEEIKTGADLDAIANYITRDVFNSKGSKHSNTPDVGLLNYRAAQQEREEKKEKNLVIQAKTNANGEVVTTNMINPKTGEKTKVTSFSINKPIIYDKGGVKYTVTNLYRDETGNIIFTGESTKEVSEVNNITNEEKKIKKTYPFNTSTDEGGVALANNFARAMGLNDLSGVNDQMDKDLQEKGSPGSPTGFKRTSKKGGIPRAKKGDFVTRADIKKQVEAGKSDGKTVEQKIQEYKDLGYGIN